MRSAPGGLAPARPTKRASVPPAQIDLGLPAGTAVQSMALDGDRLAINTGAEIIIVDVRKNEVISRIATISK